MLSSNDNKVDLFEKNFKLIFNIKKIYLDKVNTTNNLNGFLLINDNNITELNLESKFSNKQNIKFTIIYSIF